MPPIKRPGYVDVDTYQKKTSLEEAARDCGAQIEVHGSGRNVRIDCPFNCPGDHAGKREIVVDTENPAKQFDCKAYACQVKGNMLGIMYGLATGELWTGDKLRGSEFNVVKEIIRKKLAETLEERPTTPSPPKAEEESDAKPSVPATPKKNVPLAESDQEHVRALVGLEEKLILDPATMKPEAARYVRQRLHFLTEDIRREFGVGVMPGDGGGDKRGFSLRNDMVYPVFSEANEVEAYIGRDTEYERKRREYEAIKAELRDPKKAPAKFKVPKGYEKSLGFFGQQRKRLVDHPGYRELLKRYGVIVVEGFNDVLRLARETIPSIGAMSNRMSAAQREKGVRLARTLGDGKISLWYDCDEPGEAGMKEDLWMLKQLAPEIHVRIAWSRSMYDGVFAGQEPENVDAEKMREVILLGLER